MKQSLLFVLALLMVAGASAQVKKSATAVMSPQLQGISVARPQVKMEENQMRSPGTPVVKAPKKEDNVEVWYRRPAGAFPAGFVVEDGAYSGLLYAPYIAVKPFAEYTFKGFVKGSSPETPIYWEVEHSGKTEEGYDTLGWSVVEGLDLTFKWDIGVFDAPFLYAGDHWWCLSGYAMSGTSTKPVIDEKYISKILSVSSTMEIWDTDFLKSSKNFCYGGRNGDQRYPMTYYSGAEPYGTNESGWWFGKNGYHQLAEPRFFIDGIAQAFEKPDAPYLLNQVVLDCAVLEVADQVEMTCKIYKLDEIPAYGDTTEAVLPEEPGELIAKGRAIVTPETEATTGGLVFFTLYGEEDGLEYDITPTIDCAILVVIDGYNDPEMANLTDFSAMICSDMQVDEGFGELAYLKFGRPDAEGNINYHWTGLNNFFSSGTMMTGLTILLSTELPYLAFSRDEENGKYIFGPEGGPMEQIFDGQVCRGIEFLSYVPCEDEGWTVSCNGGEVPEWLNIELTDVTNDNGSFLGMVRAEVTAEPLPEGLNNRKAVVRFEYPGAYIDYTFIQDGGHVPEFRCDVNGDGEVNINDVNTLVDYIIKGYDVNIVHINMVIACILGQSDVW